MDLDLPVLGRSRGIASAQMACADDSGYFWPPRGQDLAALADCLAEGGVISVDMEGEEGHCFRMVRTAVSGIAHRASKTT